MAWGTTAQAYTKAVTTMVHHQNDGITSRFTTMHTAAPTTESSSSRRLTKIVFLPAARRRIYRRAVRVRQPGQGVRKRRQHRRRGNVHITRPAMFHPYRLLSPA